MTIDILERLIEIDQAWLLAINGAHTAWLDQIFWYISQAWVWIPLYIILVGLLVMQFGWRKGLLMVLGLAIVAGLSDYVASGIIKPFVCRLRPTHEPALEGLVHIVNGYTGGLYGFVSSHAANTFSVALLFALFWQQKNSHGWWLLVYAGLNCYSRMYLGVHYPGDILGGLLVGGAMALLVFWGYRLVDGKLHVGDAADHQPDVP